MISRKLSASSLRRDKGRLDRGAAAVEMALVLPVLLFLLMAMIDFGRGFNATIVSSQAAREGVRLASLNPTGLTTGTIATNPYGDAAIVDRVKNAAGGLSGTYAASCSPPAAGLNVTNVCVTYCPVPAGLSDTASVVLRSNFTWITGISAMSKFIAGSATSFTSPSVVQSMGVMRCAG